MWIFGSKASGRRGFSWRFSGSSLPHGAGLQDCRKSDRHHNSTRENETLHGWQAMLDQRFTEMTARKTVPFLSQMPAGWKGDAPLGSVLGRGGRGGIDARWGVYGYLIRTASVGTDPGCGKSDAAPMGRPDLQSIRLKSAYDLARPNTLVYRRSSNKIPRAESAANSVIRMASRRSTNSASRVGWDHRRSHTTFGGGPNAAASS